MKILKTTLAATALALLISAPMTATADDAATTAANPCAAATAKPCPTKAHKNHKIETMRMLKETMEIVKNLDNAPSAEDKARLAKMIEDLDASIKACETHMKEWEGKDPGDGHHHGYSH